MFDSCLIVAGNILWYQSKKLYKSLKKYFKISLKQIIIQLYSVNLFDSCLIFTGNILWYQSKKLYKSLKNILKLVWNKLLFYYIL